MTDGRGRVIAAATDGACRGNPGPGGWGAILRFEDGSEEEFGGHEAATTNNRMELQAAIEILTHLKKLSIHPALTIKTDSKYLINGFSQWINGWKKKGWKTSSGKKVLNQDLWEALDQNRINGVKFEYVKGHSGDPDNERVDAIAVNFSRNIPQNNINNQLPIKQAKNVSDNPTEECEIAPPRLLKLISRLEMADHIAKKGYALNSREIAELVETPIKEIEKKQKAWRWRNWVIEPINNSLWRLQPHQKPTDN